MASQEQERLKWEGKVTAKLNNPTSQQVWSLLEDFCNLHKWHPSIETCYRVEGDNGKPGLIRYCASTVPPPPPSPSPPPSDGGCNTTKMVMWCKEKLLEMDSIEKCLRYEVLENNIGIKFYEATLKVLDDDEEKKKKNGCVIEWSFVAEPIDGINTCEGLCALIELSLKGMVERMEKEFQKN